MLPWIAASLAIAALATAAVIATALEHRRIADTATAEPGQPDPRPRAVTTFGVPKRSVPRSPTPRHTRLATAPLFSGAVVESLIPVPAPASHHGARRTRSRVYFQAN